MSTAISVVSLELGELRAPPYRRILVPLDGGPLSRQALAEALKLARFADGSLVFLIVDTPFHVITTSIDMLEATRDAYELQAEAHAHETLRQAGARADDSGVPYLAVRKRSDHPHQEIIKVARELRCDLIAMGSHGRGGLSALVLGSVTQKVLTHSDIPVLVLRRSAEASPQLAIEPAGAAAAQGEIS